MSIRTKILLLIFSILTSAVGGVAITNSLVFIKDKNSYLYSTAIERVAAQDSQFQSDYQNLLERISFVFTSLDSQTAQFPDGLKSLAQQRKWGKILLFSMDQSPPQLIDYLGPDFTTGLDLHKRLETLKDSVVLIQLSIQNPNQNIILYRRGRLALYAETSFSSHSALVASPSWGIFSSSSKEIKFPENLKDSEKSRTVIRQLSLSGGGVQEFDLESRTILVSLKKLTNGDAFVFQAFDKKEIFAPIKRTVYQSLALSILILILGLSTTLFSVNSLTFNISILSSSMKSFSKSGQSQKVLIHSKDEIGEMSRVYNSMLDKIHSLLADEALKVRMQTELNTAKEVQATLIPSKKFENDYSVVQGFYKSASECGGDLWFAYQNKDLCFIFVGDATGHGVPAALITAAARAALTMITDEQMISPAATLTKLNNVLCDVAKGSRMMTAFCCVYSLNDRIVTYSNASHDQPIIVPIPKDGGKLKRNDLINIMGANSPRLGDTKNSIYAEDTISLSAGTALIIYTDGLIDAVSKKGSAFGERTLMQTVVESANKGQIQHIHNVLTRKIVEFTSDTDQPDDITFVTLYALDSSN